MNVTDKRGNLKLSYADLCSECKEKANLVMRDIAEFADFGVTASTVTAFRAKTEAFQALTFDDEMQARKISATQAKHSLSKLVKSEIRKIRLRAAFAFGQQSGKYSVFAIKGLAALAPRDLVFAARQVIKASNENFEALSTNGLTTEKLEQLSQLCTSLETSIEEQSATITDREIATEARKNAAAELYAELYRLCAIGKSVWTDINDAKQNDYILYRQTASKTAQAPVDSEATESEVLSEAI